MKKPTVRIISLLLAALLIIGLFSSALIMLVSAEDAPEVAKILAADTTVSKTMTVGKVSTSLDIAFYFMVPQFDIQTDNNDKAYVADYYVPPDSSFSMSHNTTLIVDKTVDKKNSNYYKATLKNVIYNGGSARTLQIVMYGDDDKSDKDDFVINVPIPNKYFKESSETEGGAPTSDIVVQSTIVRDSTGQKISSVDKKTGRFTVEVTFYDIGLKGESNQAIDSAKKHAFITTPTGFKLHNGSSGIVERISSSAEYPRFRATFEGVESTGTVNTLNFRVQYDFEEYEKGIKGEAIATLFQVKTESEAEDEETAPLKPNIIVQEYSYGSDAIIAGNEFNLGVVFANTSKTVAVENVVMTIEPANGFMIAAASNTTYFQSMGAGETKPYAIGLRAQPSQNTTGATGIVTDYSVTIKFSYQYLSKKEYAAGETSVKIAIPVEQIDRFSTDEITDYTSYMSVGYEGYITVPIINKGKSATMNITGTVESGSGAEFSAPPVHYGNLEAGKSGTLNINITINTPGEFKGEAVISYEDENMNQKEIREPFVIMVEQPFIPPPEMPVMPETTEQSGLTPFSIVMIVIGSLMVASPAAMFLMKRVKARGSEDIDEDF